MPNLLAYSALVIWPLIAYWIVRKRDPDCSVILLFLVPYLFLPVNVEIDLPMIPPLEKDFVASLTAFLVLFSKFKGWRILPRNGLAKFLVVLIFISPIITVAGNGDRLFYGETILPALPFLDVMSMAFSGFSMIYVPLMAGYNYLYEKENHKNLLMLVVIAAFIYSVLALWEIRMSPQLQKQIYGFFPHDWRQQIREGGFRPVIFLGHGLKVAVFIAIGFVCAAIFWKEKESPLKKYGLAKLSYLGCVLILCKTYAALVYGFISLAVVLLAKPRTWIKVSICIALAVTVFPILRSSDLVPTQQLTDFFSKYSEERAGSLQFRFDNENILLEKANERPIFGWGGWSRSRVFNERGVDISVTDGYWIVVYGARGWMGYASSFGLLCLSILAISLSKRSYELSVFTSGICLVLSLSMLDLIPNSSISPMLYLMAGALLGMSDRKGFSESEVYERKRIIKSSNGIGRSTSIPKGF